MIAFQLLDKYKSLQSKAFVYVFYTCILVFVTLVSPSLSKADQCAAIFSNAISSQQLHEVVQLRAHQIIEHQNALRASHGLPLFTPKDYVKNLQKKVHNNISPERPYKVVNSKLVITGLNESMTYPRLRVDDVYSLNYVYRFEGTRLVEAIPASIYYISKMGESITLYRRMSYEEMSLWQAKDMNALLSHPKAMGWGYKEPIVHFSVKLRDQGQTTMQIQLPRETLLRWAHEKKITIGSENGKPSGIEIVVKSSVWTELLSYF